MQTTNNIHFEYDSIKNWKKPDIKSILMYRGFGVYFFIGSIFAFYSKGAEMHNYEKAMHVFLVLGGGFQAIFPLSMLKPSKYISSKYLKIENGFIKWKLGRSKKQTEIKINEISEVRFFVGQVRFTMKNGELEILKIHELHHAEKHSEFMGILKKEIRPQVLSESKLMSRMVS